MYSVLCAPCCKLYGTPVQESLQASVPAEVTSKKKSALEETNRIEIDFMARCARSGTCSVVEAKEAFKRALNALYVSGPGEQRLVLHTTALRQLLLMKQTEEKPSEKETGGRLRRGVPEMIAEQIVSRVHEVATEALRASFANRYHEFTKR